MTTPPNQIIWLCPSCNKVPRPRGTVGGQYRMECQCGVSGPWADGRGKAALMWNRLAVDVQMARTRNNAAAVPFVRE